MINLKPYISFDVPHRNKSHRGDFCKRIMISVRSIRYGFGYGGPCLPRDNRAMVKAAERVELNLPISAATDQANGFHRDFQREAFEEAYHKEEQIIFSGLTYKPDSDIIEESQRLELAVDLAKKGYRVLLRDREVVIDQIRAIYDDLFTYEVAEDE